MTEQEKKETRYSAMGAWWNSLKDKQRCARGATATHEMGFIIIDECLNAGIDPLDAFCVRRRVDESGAGTFRAYCIWLHDTYIPAVAAGKEPAPKGQSEYKDEESPELPWDKHAASGSGQDDEGPEGKESPETDATRQEGTGDGDRGSGDGPADSQEDPSGGDAGRQEESGSTDEGADGPETSGDGKQEKAGTAEGEGREDHGTAKDKAGHGDHEAPGSRKPEDQPGKKDPSPMSDAANGIIDLIRMIAREEAQKAARSTAANDSITINVPGRKARTVRGIRHKRFGDVLRLVAEGQPVYLHGPAGTGKNVLAGQVADALCLPFYYTGAVIDPWTGIKGFTDANGTYQPSCFYEAFTKGGLFMLDEMDASSPEALVMLNAAIANRYFDFPAPIGRKDAHPDFRVIAAGNTEGFGADDQYTGRQRIDQSTIDRFISIDMDYDPRIDRAAATDRDGKTDEQLVTFATALRKAVAKTGIRISIGTRSIAQAVACSFMDRKDAIKACFLKGVSRDDRDILRKRLSDDESLDGNEWALAFQGMRD